jgi:hypothetical protein
MLLLTTQLEELRRNEAKTKTDINISKMHEIDLNTQAQNLKSSLKRGEKEVSRDPTLFQLSI